MVGLIGSKAITVLGYAPTWAASFLRLVHRQFVGQDRNEDQIVHPEHHLESNEGEKRKPGGGI
jgi:hypothetical protein